MKTRILPVSKWLDHHHRVEHNNGRVIHVFAVEHGNVYGGEDAAKHYEIAFSLDLPIKVINDTC